MLLCVVAAATGSSAQIQKNTKPLNKDLSAIADGDEKDPEKDFDDVLDDYDPDMEDEDDD